LWVAPLSLHPTGQHSSLADDLQVLAVMILAVFGVGYARLIWRNRFVRRQEQINEEKRIRLLELRRSGQSVESRKSQEVPFGVRAIQSGIQVDGIWISNNTLPIATIPKLGHLRGTSTNLATSSPTSARRSMDIALQDVRPLSTGGRPLVRQSAPLGLPRGSDHEPQEILGDHMSFKPRQSYHPRFNSHGEVPFNEGTLGRLEGKTSAKKVKYHRLSESYSTEQKCNSSSGAVANNERSSLSYLDTGMPKSIETRAGIQNQSMSRFAARSSSFQPLANLSKMPFLPQTSYTEYSSIPIESPESENSDPFEKVPTSHAESSVWPKAANAQTGQEFTVFSESQVPVSPQTQARPSFQPGELHANRVIRKVNSGFEVLPAGTFGVPPEFKAKGVEQEERQASDDKKRHSNRLQKKGQNPMA